MCVYVCACGCVCVCVFVCVCVHVCVCVCVCVHMYVCAYVCVDVFGGMCVRACVAGVCACRCEHVCRGCAPPLSFFLSSCNCAWCVLFVSICMTPAELVWAHAYVP